MDRRHTTWMLIHPRSATFVSCLCFSLAKFHMKHTIRCCVRAGGLSGLPSSSECAAVAGRPPYRWSEVLPLLPWVIRSARRAGPTSWSRQARPLPWFRADGRYSVPLLAAQSRHEEPYPPISKIKCRLAFERQDGNSMPHSSAQRKRDFGKLKFCARFEM